MRKRTEYASLCTAYMGSTSLLATPSASSHASRRAWRQIDIDMPRTAPSVALFQLPALQRRLRRLLYVYALRHPASGYVQGVNDLATPFLLVFLAERVGVTIEEAASADFDAGRVGGLPPAVLDEVEADTYWCLSRLLDSVQDHYTEGQPGIQRVLQRMQEVVCRVDAPLYRHLDEQDARFFQFAFRWANCFLIRELPLPLIVRAWDTYLSEERGEGFSEFHAYVCAAFLVRWSEKLRHVEFQEILLFLQSLQTSDWTNQDIELLLSQAFSWWSLFSPSHLQGADIVRERLGADPVAE